MRISGSVMPFAFVQILAATADAMHLFGHVDHLEPSRERTHEIAGDGGGNTAGGFQQLRHALGIAFAASDRGLAAFLDDVEQFIAALLANHLPHEHPEHVHVFAQCGILDGKEQILARHGG